MNIIFPSMYYTYELQFFLCAYVKKQFHFSSSMTGVSLLDLLFLRGGANTYSRP